MLKCKNCGAAILEKDKFCSGCGSEIIKPKNNCAKCGNKISPTDKFCGNCGTEISNEEQVKTESLNLVAKKTDKESSSMEINKHKKEIKVYDRILESDPEDINALVNKGFSLIKLGKYQEAIEICDEALESDPEDINAFVNKGVSLIKLSKYQEAIEICDEALESDPRNANILSGKGTSLMELNKYKEAIEVLDNALELNPQNTDALNDRDFCLGKLKITNRQKDDEEYENINDDDEKEYENISNTEKQSSFDYYTRVIENYSDFSGRSTRAEYWYFMLYNIIIAIGIAIFGVIIGDGGMLYVLYLFIIFIPHLAVGIRRLHDIGKSGWLIILAFIPILNLIILILFMIDSNKGENKYGPNPKKSFV